MSARTPEATDIKATLPQAKGGPEEARVPTKLMIGENADGTPRYVLANLPRSAIGRTGVVTLTIDAAGNIVPVWQSWSDRIRVTEDIGERLGLPVSRLTVMGWLLAGFVEGEVMGPGLTWISLTSLERFIKACSAPNAREWWTQERLLRQKDAYDTIRSQGLKARLPHAPRAVAEEAEDEDAAEAAEIAARRAAGEQLSLFTDEETLTRKSA